MKSCKKRGHSGVLTFWRFQILKKSPGRFSERPGESLRQIVNYFYKYKCVQTFFSKPAELHHKARRV